MKKNTNPSNVYNMKRVFLLIMIFTTLDLHAQGQNNYMTNDKIQEFLDSMIVHKNQFIGKTMGEIYQLFEQVRLPMRHFSYGETSPWVDPEGKTYLTSVLLYSESLEGMNDGKEYFDIIFELDIPKLEIGVFEDSMSSETWEIFWISFKQRTMNMEIKKISFRRLTLPLHF